MAAPVKRKQGQGSVWWQHERWLLSLILFCLLLLLFAASSFPFLVENSRGKEGDERKV
jgi:hypothetical protein